MDTDDPSTKSSGGASSSSRPTKRHSKQKEEGKKDTPRTKSPRSSGTGERSRSSRSLGKRSSSHRASAGQSSSSSARSLEARRDGLISQSSRASGKNKSSSSRSLRIDEKAGHRSSRGGPATAPGVQGERPSPRRSGSRRSIDDEKAGHRSSRGPATAPGVQAERPSPRRSGSRRKSSDEKAAHRSSRGPATVPGARPELSSSRRSNSSRSNRDEKAAHRSSRGPAIVPGARPELSSSRRSSSRSNRDEKVKERRSVRASKPGAEASTSANDRTKAKSSSSGRRNNNSEKSLNIIAANEGAPQFNENGEAVVAATLIDEEEKQDEDTIKEREQARAREIERDQWQREAENRRLKREEDERKEKRKELEEKKRKKKKKKKKRNMILCVVLAVLVIGGGVVAFFMLQGGSSSDTTVAQTTDKEQEDTFGPPSVDSSTSPTLSPSDDPSSSPTNVPLKYNLPSADECERLASGLSIDGENEMFDRSFAILMEVHLLDDSDVDPFLPDLETKIEKLLVPDLIGCPRGLFNKRRLGLHHEQNQAGIMSNVSDHSRQLQNVNIRYAIAKAIVAVTMTDDACERSSSPNCSVASANLDLKVRGDENIGLLAEVIQNVFPNGKDIRPDLELITPFDTIVIGIMRSLDPTQPPTIAPTGTESENPSGLPSSSPSTSPRDIETLDPAPVVAATKAPSKSPTKSPTKAPTPQPTLAPTPTPPPTLAPQPGLTGQPTPPPTPRPTLAPTKSPTRKPSMAPSVIPTASPAPSQAPSSGPTDAPTLGSNGSSCTAGEECESGLCSYISFCVECILHSDCTSSSNGTRCFQDEALTQPSYCVPLGTNGGACNEGDDCESGICDFIGQSYMCVECMSNLDCATSSEGSLCVRDVSTTSATASFCAPLANTGDPCTYGEDCESGFCEPIGSSQMCVECISNYECIGSAGGTRCVRDVSATSTTPNVCGPLGSSGDPCVGSEDCESYMCDYIGESYMCVECMSNVHCTYSNEGPLCIRDVSTSATTPSFCAPLASIGDPCTSGEDCESDFCEPIGLGQLCVECFSNDECIDSASGPRCVRDVSATSTTPNVCGPAASNGDPCFEPEDCESGLMCAYVGQSNMCVECMSDLDCLNASGGPVCVIDSSSTATTPWFCGPKASNGDPCETDQDCESGRCGFVNDESLMCVECVYNSDCSNYSIASGNPYRCTQNIGMDEHCDTPWNTQCDTPWHCVPDVMGSGDPCETDQDCDGNLCEYLGTSVIKYCYDCEDDSDCTDSSDGPRCVYHPNPEDRTPPFCGRLGSPGDFCNRHEDCLSNSCILYPIWVCAP